MAHDEWIGIGAFAKLSGLTVETLRHYHQAEPTELTAAERVAKVLNS